MPNFIMLSVIMPKVITSNVIMSNVIIPNVVAPEDVGLFLCLNVFLMIGYGSVGWGLRVKAKPKEL
jgi:hypothetical protein